MIKVALVLPRPFIILVSVVDKKMKGHKKDNISTNTPTASFLKTKQAISFPRVIKKTVENTPRINVVHKHMEEVRLTLSGLSDNSEIAGRRMTESELVIVAGNIMKGMAMPVRTAYTDKASPELIPYFFNITGIINVSTLCKTAIISLLPVRGAASLRSLALTG